MVIGLTEMGMTSITQIIEGCYIYRNQERIFDQSVKDSKRILIMIAITKENLVLGLS